MGWGWKYSFSNLLKSNKFSNKSQFLRNLIILFKKVSFFCKISTLFIKIILVFKISILYHFSVPVRVRLELSVRLRGRPRRGVRGPLQLPTPEARPLKEIVQPSGLDRANSDMSKFELSDLKLSNLNMFKF